MDKEKWNIWWRDLLTTKKLTGKVDELNQYDESLGREPVTERICKDIYLSYDDLNYKFENIKDELLNMLGKLEQVHLQCGRVKTIDSLIEKVIKKRYENIASKTSEYANISDKNYQEIITDLVGVRLIVNYRGKWQDIHDKILEYYPMRDESEYADCEHIKHIEGEEFIAEIPTVYYAAGDNVAQYEQLKLKTKVHKRGYRSIHYILSVSNTYVELQVRTIYDEAWSDCDHSYVYKRDANPNNRALIMLSEILCDITNTANDIGDNMHDIYYGNGFRQIKSNKWCANKDTINFYKQMQDNLQKAERKLKEFNDSLIEEDSLN